MQAGLTISIVYSDVHLMEIEMRAWNQRFTGSTRIYIGFQQLSEFASHIAGFPSRVPDERIYEFGTRDPGYVRGYCGLRFHTVDSIGHSIVELDIEGDDHHYSYESAKFSIPVEAAAIDRFLTRLREIEAAKSGEAVLGQLE